jgi:hypothetical protein
MSVIARIFVVLFAYLIGCVAASTVLTIGTLSPAWDDLTAAGFQSGAMWVVVFISAAVIAAVAILPAMLVIALAEGFAWRSILIYGILGAGISMSLSYGLDFTGYVADPDSLLAHERLVLAAAGIAGGFAYWLLAGRRAGAWQRS